MHLSLSFLALLLLTIIFSPFADSRIFDDALDANSLAQQDLEKVILQTPTNIHRNRPHQPHHPPHPHIIKKTATEGDQEADENGVAEETNPSEEGPSGAITYVIGMLDKAFHFLNLKKIVKNVQNHRSTPGACYACRAAMAMVKFLIEYGRGLSDVAYVTSYFCKSLDVQTPRVCEGYVNNFMEEFVVVMSKVDIDSHEICGTLLGDSCSQVTDPRHNWSLPLPPTVRRRKSLLQRPFSSLFWQQSSFNGGSSIGRKDGKKASSVSVVKPFKVLQISDIHLDPEYKEGSNAVCGEPLCCRPSSPGSNLAINADRKAGYWGDYRDCDIPLHTVEETFRYIRDNHPDIDYILWTGDIPPHDIWSQTRDSQLELINVVGSLLDQYFGHIPIYPVVGNHESLPMNSFPQPTAEIENKYTKGWLYDKLSESWLRWLPLETQTTIEKGAFFAARPKSGLKIISLNTNFCNNQNWWILLNSTDPGDQLQWLIKQLTESEELGEMVQILGHVPPGSSDCIQMWSRNYNRIINRFSHIIKGQFFGHTHNDEFEIFYEDVTPRTDQTFFYDKTYKATNVAYIGPSITTFGNVNPGYRIYTVDPYSFDLLDHETYFLNLTAANGHRNSQSLQFEKSYSAKKAYGLKNLSAAEWHKLVMRMRTPRSSEDRIGGAVQKAERLFQQFYRYFYNRSDNLGDNQCDDESCKYEILCRLVTALSQDTAICRHFLM